jgi:hypothetical protein
MIPYPRNSFFLGREQFLEQIHTHLHTSQTAALSQSPSALSGLGGIVQDPDRHRICLWVPSRL